MAITFMQTSDPSRYIPLLEISSLTVKAYTYKFGHSYTTFVGIRRGRSLWQASYNRIPMLMEMVEAGYDGWVCYMDVDSYIADLDFDLSGYLKDKKSIALIAAHSGVLPAIWHDINNGVFLINLGHPLGKQLVKTWHSRFMEITDAELWAAEIWGDVPNDQTLLHLAMQDVSGLRDAVMVDMGHPRLLNYASGQFIRQVLRAGGGSIKQRAETMMAGVKLVLPNEEVAFGLGHVPINTDVSLLEEYFIESIYRIFLLRNPSTSEFRDALRRFRAKKSSFEQEMRDCLSSVEFSTKAEAFIAKFAPNANISKRQ